MQKRKGDLPKLNGATSAAHLGAVVNQWAMMLHQQGDE
jgi:hypothetical protein